MDDLGAELRHARTEAGGTLASIADRSCYSAAHLSNVEAGRRTATPDVVPDGPGCTSQYSSPGSAH
ncbi:helix-turn-helix domain-containing protein [Micromonospora ureilytica]|nr:helix-turn-helix domain-containing protein [Micromonospora ureilytica]